MHNCCRINAQRTLTENWPNQVVDSIQTGKFPLFNIANLETVPEDRTITEKIGVSKIYGKVVSDAIVDSSMCDLDSIPSSRAGSVSEKEWFSADAEDCFAVEFYELGVADPRSVTRLIPHKHLVYETFLVVSSLDISLGITVWLCHRSRQNT